MTYMSIVNLTYTKLASVYACMCAVFAVSNLKKKTGSSYNYDVQCLSE